MLSWLIYQHNGLGHADFSRRDEIWHGDQGKERELDEKGREDASKDDDRSRNNFIQLST